jgi:hypothetical protein
VNVGGVGPYHEDDEAKRSRDYYLEIQRAERTSRIFIAAMRAIVILGAAWCVWHYILKGIL